MKNTSENLRSATYELFIGALSVLSIINLVLYYFLENPVVSEVIRDIDVLLSIIFLSDFLYRLFTADSKPTYFFRQQGWADLLTSSPMPIFKILRIFHLFHSGRYMKATGGRRMMREFISNRSGSTLLSLILLMILILEFGGLVLLSVESRSSDANIQSASDVLWYIYVTITTIGYGDRYPVTNSGRAIGVLIMTAGVSLFGTLTAFLANAFIKPERQKPAKTLEPSSIPPDLQAQMAEIRQIFQVAENSNAELKNKIENLEITIRKYYPVD